jgi:hypothetical protein
MLQRDYGYYLLQGISYMPEPKEAEVKKDSSGLYST